MKKILIIIILIPSVFSIRAQYQTNTNHLEADYFEDPIFAGDYPDPSIIRDGGSYYIVHSSFEYYPGLLIWQSKDLINWTPVTNALYKYLGAVWAPDLVKYKNKYYIYFPANNNIYVVTANSINGPWSDPVDLNISNIDPGHFVDKNEKRYLYFSNGGYVPLLDDGLSVIGESSPLLCVPSDNSYIDEVKLFIEGDATGGLILFYNNDYNSGILADSENILANLNGWQFITESNAIKIIFF